MGFDKNRFIFGGVLALLFSSTAINGDAVLFLFPTGHKLKKRQTVNEYLDKTDISLLNSTRAVSQ